MLSDAAALSGRDTNHRDQVSKDVLTKADAVIHGDRQAAYGSPEESFNRIAAFWMDYLGERCPDGITGYDVAMMMVLLKVSRSTTDHKLDTFVDLAGYAALAPRLAR